MQAPQPEDGAPMPLPTPPPDDALGKVMTLALVEYLKGHPEAAQVIRRTAERAVRQLPRPPARVTLLQAAILCKRAKKTLERLKHVEGFPAPVNGEGRRNGQALEYHWHEMRSFLQHHYGILLPERLPDEEAAGF
jgi:hypothetical protein